MTMKVLLNGAPQQLAVVNPAVDQALALAGIGATGGVAVAVNGTVVPRSAWASTPLSDGDRIEVVTAVQGG